MRPDVSKDLEKLRQEADMSQTLSAQHRNRRKDMFEGAKTFLHDKKASLYNAIYLTPINWHNRVRTAALNLVCQIDFINPQG